MVVMMDMMTSVALVSVSVFTSMCNRDCDINIKWMIKLMAVDTPMKLL